MSLDSDPAQATLSVGARDDLGRPDHTADAVFCSCGREVSETRKSHRVARSYITEQVAVDEGIDKIPVYGWYCKFCSRVLALDPHSTDHDHDLGPGAGWLTVEADLARGTRGQVLVPTEVVLG